MTGLNPPGPLSYEGSLAVPYVNRPYPPQTSFINFNVPTIYTDTTSKISYILVSKAFGIADWTEIGGGSSQVSTLTGDTGGPVPPTDGNISILGTPGQINVSGNPGTSTLTLSLSGGGQAVDSFSTTTGGPVTPDSNGNIALTGASSTYTNGSVANTIRTEVQGTNHALFVGRGTNTAATTLAAATNGQLPIGSNGADPSLATLTAGPGISVTNGAGSITLSTTSATLPAFLVGLQAVVTNVTGDATLYTMTWDTTTFNQVGFFVGPTNAVVPANLGGLYQLNLQIAMQGIEATHTVGEIAVLINGAGYNAQFNPAECCDTSGRLTWNVPVTALLVAGDSLTATIQVSGGPKTLDVGGSAGFCFWSGVKTN